jgi:hypothetical protein
VLNVFDEEYFASANEVPAVLPGRTYLDRQAAARKDEVSLEGWGRTFPAGVALSVRAETGFLGSLANLHTSVLHT